ncbi:MAG: thioredoxin [Paludibacteraceae bacterium]|jgi:thioredoxin 1|nr:thioredoxin [Paludibacteraceae bacterium]
MVLEVLDANIKTLLAENSILVVDFWAPWCGPCKMMLPVVEELAAEYEGRVPVGKLNVDENPETCEEYGIMSIPTLLFFKNGELVERIVGAARKNDVQKVIETLL